MTGLAAGIDPLAVLARLGLVAHFDGVFDIIAARRTGFMQACAARGLTLTEVGYPADELLESRAEQTRAVRRLDED